MSDRPNGIPHLMESSKAGIEYRFQELPSAQALRANAVRLARELHAVDGTKVANAPLALLKEQTHLLLRAADEDNDGLGPVHADEHLVHGSLREFRDAAKMRVFVIEGSAVERVGQWKDSVVVVRRFG